MAKYVGSIELIGGITPINGGKFPLAAAKDIQVDDDGKRLDAALREFGDTVANMVSNYPIVGGIEELQPDTYYVFGEVDELSVKLVDVDDGKTHEHCFEFIASNSFSGLTITPTPRWATHPQFVKGKTHQISIFRGIGVVVCA